MKTTHITVTLVLSLCGLSIVPAQNKNQNSDILKLKAWFTPAEMLKLMTHDNAQLLALSGPRNPYPGKLGVIEEGAYADMLLVDGDPIANISLLADPAKNFVVIIKDGKIIKNTLKYRVRHRMTPTRTRARTAALTGAAFYRHLPASQELGPFSGGLRSSHRALHPAAEE